MYRIYTSRPQILYNTLFFLLFFLSLKHKYVPPNTVTIYRTTCRKIHERKERNKQNDQKISKGSSNLLENDDETNPLFTSSGRRTHILHIYFPEDKIRNWLENVICYETISFFGCSPHYWVVFGMTRWRLKVTSSYVSVFTWNEVISWWWINHWPESLQYWKSKSIS